MAASLVTLTDVQIYELLVQAYSDAATIPADTTPGSTLSSVFGAVKLLTLAEQANISSTFSIARLATSFGPDVDSFVAPFGVSRLGSAASEGIVTFSIPTALGVDAIIPFGTTLQTSSGLKFIVIENPSSAVDSLASGGYVLAAGQTSVNVTVQCVTNGSLGDVQANQITEIYASSATQPLVGFAATNPAAFTNGSDSETDAQLKARFTLEIAGLGGGTPYSLAAAIARTQPGLTYSIGEYFTPALVPNTPAYTTIPIAVAGSGSAPPQTLIAAAQANINLVRAGGSIVTVIAPGLVAVNVTGVVTLAAGVGASVLTAAQSAATAFINAIGLDPAGAPTELVLTQLLRAILGVAGVFDVTGLQINGGTANLNAPFASLFVAGNVALTSM